MKNPLKNAAVTAGSLAIVIFAFAPLTMAVAAGKHAVSQKFAVGDPVQTNRKTGIWEKPPTRGKYAGEQKAKAAGRIVGGPVRAADMWWWKVNFDSRTDGWAPQRNLSRVGAPVDDSRPVPHPPSPQSTPQAGHDAESAIAEVSPPNGTVVHAAQMVVHGRISDDVYPAGMITASLNGSPIRLEADGRFSVKVNLSPGSNDFTLQASTPNPRQQITDITGYLDGSMIYGSDETRTKALRTFQGGMLKTSAGNLLPLNADGLDNANDAHLYSDDQLFLAGDIRANENIELTSIHVLFMREHNLLAAAIATANPRLSDEQIFQRARRLVVAEVQAITYREFLPALLGPGALRPYAGYNPNVNAGIATEFSTAAYRIGHTLVNDDVEFIDNDGEEIRGGLSLANAFFNPAPLKELGPDPLLKYLATDSAQEVDTQLVDGLRNFLFGPPGAGGLDLASLNIQRGRDHGLADYNTVRVAYGLSPVSATSQISSDPVLQGKLLALYGDIRSLDLWVGGLAEDHLPGSSVGETFQRIIADQFQRTRDGDRNWYERTFSGRQLEAIRATRLSDIIRRNTTITKIQDNVFFYDPDTTLAGLSPKAGVLPPDLVRGPLPEGSFAAFDGVGNNPLHPKWGSAGADLLRFSPAAYADGISSPSGDGRPSARLISNSVSVLTTPFANERLLSSWVYGWGQFVDHDLDLTTSGDTDFDIPVPAGDPSFDPAGTGTEVIPLSRSNFDEKTGSASPNVSQKSLRIVYEP